MDATAPFPNQAYRHLEDTPHLASSPIEPGSFDLVAVPSQALVRIVVRGFWETHVLARFQAALADTLRTVTGQGRAHVVLIDITSSAVQPQAVITEFSRMLAPDRPSPAARVAFICGNGGVRMQARRIMGDQPTMRRFEVEADALRWLLARAD